LVQLQATGLVVEVASREAFEQLKAKAAPLPLAPVSGSALAKQLGLSHYPVLLTQRLIEQ
jgi:integrating conjugative element protein (TIGR03765 family)